MTLREDVAKALGPYTDGVLEQEELTDRVLSLVRDRLLSDPAVEAAGAAMKREIANVRGGYDHAESPVEAALSAAFAAIEGDETDA